MLKDYRFPGLEKNAYYWIDRAQYEESVKHIDRALQCYIRAGEVNAKPSAPLLNALRSFIQNAFVENYLSTQGTAVIHALNSSATPKHDQVLLLICLSIFVDSKDVEGIEYVRFKTHRIIQS